MDGLSVIDRIYDLKMDRKSKGEMAMSLVLERESVAVIEDILIKDLCVMIQQNMSIERYDVESDSVGAHIGFRIKTLV